MLGQRLRRWPNIELTQAAWLSGMRPSAGPLRSSLGGRINGIIARFVVSLAWPRGHTVR